MYCIDVSGIIVHLVHVLFIYLSLLLLLLLFYTGVIFYILENLIRCARSVFVCYCDWNEDKKISIYDCVDGYIVKKKDYKCRTIR